MSSQVQTIEKAIAATSVDVVLSVSGLGGVAFQVYGTWTGTIAFDGSVDGVTYQALSTTTLNAVTSGTTTTANGVFMASVAGLTTVRARFSAYSNGTAVVRIQGIDAAPAWMASVTGGGGGTSSAFGAAFPAAGTAAGFIGDDGNMAGAELDADGNLKVNVVAGGTGGGVVDQGTAGLDPWLVAVDSSALPTGAATEATLASLDGKVTACDTGAVVVASSALPAGAATEAKQPALGTAGTASADVITVQGIAAMTPLLVNGSGSTQPVSGTVTVQQATAANLNATVVGNGTFAVQNTQQGTASQNVAQLAGTATSVNSGTKDAGTLRVVLATDQPQLTNKLLVTPDANSSVNLNQIAGNGVSADNGASGTGVQRVTIANNSTGVLASVGNVGPTLSVVAAQLTASGDTNLLGSGTEKIRRVEASNSHATTALVVGLKNANLNSGNVFGKKYLPAAGGLAVWVFPQGYLQITASTFVGNLSAAGQVEFTVYYE